MMIALKNLTKTYHLNNQAIHALDDISLDVETGEIFGVIGKSGAGKSTLIRCVNLLERPTTGEVELNHASVTQASRIDLRKIRQTTGMIFQHFNLLSSRSVFNNVALPLELIKTPKAEIKTRVDKLLKTVGLSDRKNHFPHQLSGGQKQRVAIARALAYQPKLLLCDEATSALDPEATESILTLLKEINQTLNLTILLITHEMDVIKKLCDRVGVLHHGKLVESGNVLDIFTAPEHDVTKSLVQKSTHLELPKNLIEQLQPTQQENTYPIVRLTFLGQTANTPIIADLQSNFNVAANILLADLETIHNATIGFTVCQLQGKKESVNKAIKHLDEINIKTEVLGYA